MQLWTTAADEMLSHHFFFFFLFLHSCKLREPALAGPFNFSLFYYFMAGGMLSGIKTMARRLTNSDARPQSLPLASAFCG